MLRATLIVAFTVIAVRWLGVQQSPWIRRLLDWFPAILFAYVIPAAVTHGTGWDLSDVYLHTLSREWIIPLAILCVMSAMSFRQLRIIGLRPILLFVTGSLAIAVLSPLLVLLWDILFPGSYGLFMEEGYWKGLVPIVGGWIGGSTSQLVLKELVECPEALFLAILVLDNILVNIWTILMFQFIKKSDRLNHWFRINDPVPDFVPDELDLRRQSPRSVLITLSVTVCIVVLCNLLISSFLAKVVVLSLAGLALGNLVPPWNHTLVLKLGGILIVLIMAILGLRLDFSGFSLPGLLIGLVVVWLLLHFVVLLFVAWLLRLHLAWVPIASMANVGGISTAPAVTAAYNEEWMPHAILLAILSMVTGTAWGMVTMWVFGWL